jgi:hypothetical protein
LAKGRPPVQAHVAALHQQALPGLSGLEKTKAEQRIAEAAKVHGSGSA